MNESRVGPSVQYPDQYRDQGTLQLISIQPHSYSGAADCQSLVHCHGKLENFLES